MAQKRATVCEHGGFYYVCLAVQKKVVDKIMAVKNIGGWNYGEIRRNPPHFARHNWNSGA